MGLPGTIFGVVAVVIIFGYLLLGIWIYLFISIVQKIIATIVVIFFGGGLIVSIIGGYKLLHHEVFFKSGKK